MSDRAFAEAFTRQQTTVTWERYTCPPAGFEPAFPASERPQTHALDSTATTLGVECPNSLHYSLWWRVYFRLSGYRTTNPRL